LFALGTQAFAADVKVDLSRRTRKCRRSRSQAKGSGTITVGDDKS
jgi:hypothetical protein